MNELVSTEAKEKKYDQYYSEKVYFYLNLNYCRIATVFVTYVNFTFI